MRHVGSLGCWHVPGPGMNKAHASESGARVEAQVVDDFVLRCSESFRCILAGHEVQSRLMGSPPSDEVVHDHRYAGFGLSLQCDTGSVSLVCLVSFCCTLDCSFTSSPQKKKSISFSASCKTRQQNSRCFSRTTHSQHTSCFSFAVPQGISGCAFRGQKTPSLLPGATMKTWTWFRQVLGTECPVWCAHFGDPCTLGKRA